VTAPRPASAIITGGGTGIGRGIVEALARAGVNCVIAGRRREPLDDALAELADAPGDVAAVVADVTEEAGRAAIAQACLDNHGSIDVLVNNAGVTATAPLLSYEVADWRRVFVTNVEAAFFMARTVLATMRDAGWGRIVNIGSVYGSLGLNNDYYEGRLPWDTPGDSGPVREVAYSASKGALIQLTRELATAVGRWNITVNTVTPGMIPVDAIPMAPDIRRRLEAMTPMQRTGNPGDVAAAVRYLVSEDAAFVTGAELRVDGGWSIW
jgi:NAD(P)-dependent dehydrogenase (short-subunit alcohol dehydrogenase family)